MDQYIWNLKQTRWASMMALCPTQIGIVWPTQWEPSGSKCPLLELDGENVLKSNSAADCSILVQFCAKFEHVTFAVLQTFKVKGSRSQPENVVWSPNYCFLLRNRGRWANGDVRILIGSCEIAVCAHAQYKIGQNSPERLARRRKASSCNAFVIATFHS